MIAVPSTSPVKTSLANLRTRRESPLSIMDKPEIENIWRRQVVYNLRLFKLVRELRKFANSNSLKEKHEIDKLVSAFPIQTEDKK